MLPLPWVKSSPKPSFVPLFKGCHFLIKSRPLIPLPASSPPCNPLSPKKAKFGQSLHIRSSWVVLMSCARGSLARLQPRAYGFGRVLVLHIQRPFVRLKLRVQGSLAWLKPCMQGSSNALVPRAYGPLARLVQFANGSNEKNSTRGSQKLRLSSILGGDVFTHDTPMGNLVWPIPMTTANQG